MQLILIDIDRYLNHGCLNLCVSLVYSLSCFYSSIPLVVDKRQRKQEKKGKRKKDLRFIRVVVYIWGHFFLYMQMPVC